MGRAKGRDLINRFGPGVGYLNYLAVPGVGIFKFSSCLGPQTLSGCFFLGIRKRGVNRSTDRRIWLIF